MKTELNDEKFIYSVEQIRNFPKCYSKNGQTMKTNGGNDNGILVAVLDFRIKFTRSIIWLEITHKQRITE